MFASIRRHQKWLWMVIVVGVIVSFVFFFTPQQGQYQGGPTSEVIGSIYGDSLTRTEYFQAAREARLRYRLFAQKWPDEDESARMTFNEDREIQTRLVLNRNLNRLNVHVPDSLVAQWIINVFKDPEQNSYNHETYRAFFDAQLRPRGYTERHLRDFVAHELGIQHLVSVFGTSGRLMPPQEAELQFRREREEVDTQAVFFNATNYVALVEIDPAALATFFTNQSFRYRLQERVQVDYVKFAATNFLAEAEQKLNQSTNLDLGIEQMYQQRGTNYYAGLTADQAKQKIKEEILTGLEIVEARKKANEFTEKLLELEPPKPENLAKLAAAEGLVSATTEPFSRFDGPAGLDVPENFPQVAFNLSPENPYPQEPSVGQDGVYVISFKSKIPSELPPLESVLEKVTEDYRQNRAQELARQAGRDFHAAATNALAAGKTFQALAEESKADFVDVPPFSQQIPIVPELRGKAELASVKNAAFAAKPGELSAFTPTREGGFVLWIEKRIPVSEEKVKADLSGFVKSLRQSQQYEAFEEWLRRELEKAQLSLPTSGRNSPSAE